MYTQNLFVKNTYHRNVVDYMEQRQYWTWLLIPYESMYSRMDQVKVFKGCLPQNLLGLFLNTLSHMTLEIKRTVVLPHPPLGYQMSLIFFKSLANQAFFYSYVIHFQTTFGEYLTRGFWYMVFKWWKNLINLDFGIECHLRNPLFLSSIDLKLTLRIPENTTSWFTQLGKC